MSNTLKPMNWKRSMNIKALLNVHNFKTKTPFDKWSISYDRGLQNTAFVEKMMRALPYVGAFQKSPDGNQVKTERSTTIHELQKIMDKEAQSVTLKLNLQVMDGVHHMIALYKIQKYKKWWELCRMSGFSEKSQRKLSPLVLNYLL